MMCGKCKKMCGAMTLLVGLLWLATGPFNMVALPIKGVDWLGLMLVVMGAIKVFVQCPECAGGCCGK